MSKVIQNLRKENKGSTLLLVIICMSLVTVLATLILSITIMNLQMKEVTKKSSENFYTAEGVVDELTGGIKAQANDALRDAYQLLLQKYALTSPNNREELFINKMKELLEVKLRADFITNFKANDYNAPNWSYLDRTPSELTAVTWSTAPTAVILTSGTSGDSVRLEGVILTYTDAQGYSTTISTDIVIKLNYPDFLEDKEFAGNEFLEYIVIADSDVKTNDTSSSNIIDLNGNLFSGSKFLVSQNVVSLDADYLVVNGSIEVKNKGSLSINKGNALASTSCKMWVSNIMTEPFSITATSSNNLSIVNSDCFVADDLTIDGIDDTVSITNSNYYGYSSSAVMGTANDSSAININARDINLNLNLNKLWLSGSSYISVPSGYGSYFDNLGVASVTTSRLQGESLAFKGNQAAYLLPGDCIEGYGCNPFPRPDAWSTKSESEVEAQLDLIVNIYTAESIGGLPLEKYLDRSKPYDAVFVQYAQGVEMVYVYMNFRSEDAARDYFIDYVALNEGLVAVRMKTFGNGLISINATELKTVGNLLSVDASGVSSIVNQDESKRASKTDSDIREMDFTSATRFNNLKKTLNTEMRYYGSGNTLTDCIFRFTDVLPKLTAANLSTVYTDGYTYKLYAKTSDITLDNSYTHGLILVKGNVIIPDGLSFKGLIIATGTVQIGAGVTLTAAPEAVKALIEQNDGSGLMDELLRQFFVAYDTFTPGSTPVDAIEVSYDNWRKN